MLQLFFNNICETTAVEHNNARFLVDLIVYDGFDVRYHYIFGATVEREYAPSLLTAPRAGVTAKSGFCCVSILGLGMPLPW